MKILIWLLSPLVVISVVVASLLFVLTQTVINADYLTATAKKANLYENVSTILPRQLIGHGEGNANEKEKRIQTISEIFNPAVLETKVTDVLRQFNNYLFHDGPDVTVDISEQAEQAKSKGLELPDGANKPINLTNEKMSKLREIATKFVQVKRIVMVVTVALLVIFVSLVIASKQYAGAVVIGVILSVIYAALFGFLPQVPKIVLGTFASDPKQEAYVPILKPFIIQLASDISHLFVYFAIVMILFTAVWVVVSHKKMPAGQPELKKATA